MTMLDLKTGLPQLPEGYFFRIKKWNGGSFFYDVQIIIRRRILWFSLSTHCSGLANSHAASLYHTNVLEGAISALSEFNNKARVRALKRQKYIDPRIALLGDYPPKKYSAPDA